MKEAEPRRILSAQVDPRSRGGSRSSPAPTTAVDPAGARRNIFDTPAARGNGERCRALGSRSARGRPRRRRASPRLRGGGAVLPAHASGHAWRCHKRTTELDTTEARLYGPILLLDRRARERFEDRLVITLAGPIAEYVFTAPAPSRPRPHPDEHAVREILKRRERLAPAARERPEATEAEPPGGPTDWDTAQRLVRYATTLDVGPAGLYLAWLAREVELVVRDREFRLPLARLARALYDARELDGDSLRHVLAAENTRRLADVA